MLDKVTTILLTLFLSGSTVWGGASGTRGAEILKVSARGEAGAYTFAVTVRAEETGCGRYTDWWEVLDESGRLIYRRILFHSHPNEQPFTRSGGPVAVSARQRVYIRAHMHPDGYGPSLFAGSVAQGFAPQKTPVTFDPALERTPPLPQGCAF